MRVLILADDCNPQWPSLPVVGYKAARAIANHADVVVATHVRNRENLSSAGFGRAEVRYVDNEYVAQPLYKLGTKLRGGDATGWTTAIAISYPSYVAFEWEVWRAFKQELLAGKFDVVHRITPMSPTLPSPLAAWSPVPFVLGPLNGGLKWPAAFREELAREREWLSYLRNAYRALPYLSRTYRSSAAILAAFDHTIADLPARGRDRAINFPEVGIDPEVFDQVSVRPARKQKTILFAGRLVPYKLADVVVRAYADHPALHEHRLIVAGDGPERPLLEQIVRERGLSERVELVGWKKQAEIAALMREADIFAFPSIRELGAGVVVEAMACAMACVVVDYGGPGTLIEQDRGVKVPLAPKDELVRSFGRALERLVADPETCVRLGAAARQHAMEHYSWDAKAQKTCRVYEWVLGRGPRPDFWAPAATGFKVPAAAETSA